MIVWPTQIIPDAELITPTAGVTELVTVSANCEDVTSVGVAQTASEVSFTVKLLVPVRSVGLL